MLSLTSGGQSLEDKLYAIKYFISGQGISFVVLKATTSELLGPKKKHLTYLVTMTNEPNVSIPSLAKYLMQRALHPDWSVAFKSLITIHHLMSYGNDRFLQNLASSTINHHTFDHLSLFNDKSSTLAYDMSVFVRRYSRYVASKIQTYRLLGMDFCRMKANGVIEPSLKMRTASLDQLMSILPTLQSQFDSLLAFDATDRDLNNGIVNSAFSSLYKDFIKLYIAYQSAIIRLLKLYFTVSKVKRAQELLELYKKFLVRMDKVSDFIRVIDMVGMSKSELPSITKWPNLSLKQLEDHVNQLESPRQHRRMSIDKSSHNQVYPKIFYGTSTSGRRRSFKRDNSNLELIKSPLSTGSMRRRSLNRNKSSETYGQQPAQQVVKLDEKSELDDKRLVDCDIGGGGEWSPLMEFSHSSSEVESARICNEAEKEKEKKDKSLAPLGPAKLEQQISARTEDEEPDLMLIDELAIPVSVTTRSAKVDSMGPTSDDWVQVELL